VRQEPESPDWSPWLNGRGPLPARHAHASYKVCQLQRSFQQFMKNEAKKDSDHLRGRIVAMNGILFAFNIGAWLWTEVPFHVTQCF
jgi:hypothetical protein